MGPENYISWLRQLKQNASANGVWDLISNKEAIKVEPKRPKKPDTEAARKDAKRNSLDADATTSAIQGLLDNFKLSVDDYKLDQADYDRQNVRVRTTNALVKDSVDDAILGRIGDLSNPHKTTKAIQEACKLTNARALNDATKRLADLKLWYSDSVSEFINKAESLRLDIIDLGDSLTES